MHLPFSETPPGPGGDPFSVLLKCFVHILVVVRLYLLVMLVGADFTLIGLAFLILLNR
jgi:hypothetical protein